jgi:hypothetical protein
VVLCLGLAPGAAAPQPGAEPADRTPQTEPTRRWQVGPLRPLRTPGQAAGRARSGDVVEIDAGTYVNDHARWRQDRLILRAVGGRAHLRSDGPIPNGKAIWIIAGDDVLIEGIEFSGASVAAANGAGIRHAGGNLTVRDSYFHDNEFSILSGHRPGATITVESSRFEHQRRKNRFSHGIYIGRARRFNLIGSHFTGTDQGHQVKSRAHENFILYNRIEDGITGNASRLVDLSNCGLSVIMGNDLHQGARTSNHNAIGYGPEGCAGRPLERRRLFVVNNTFINDAASGEFVRNFADAEVVVANNLVIGPGPLLVGRGREQGNVQVPRGQWQTPAWQPPAGHPAVDAAVTLPEGDRITLVPSREFTPPVGTRERPASGPLDVGARESVR